VRSLALNNYEIGEPDGNKLILEVDPNVLSIWFFIRNLFPRLRELVIQEDFLCSLTPGISLFKNLFHDVKLAALRMETYTRMPANTFDNCTEELMNTCAHLEELEIDFRKFHSWDEDQLDWTRLSSQMLSRAARLRVFRTTIPLVCQDLICLAKLPHLMELQLRGVSDIPDNFLFLPSDAFPCLYNLEIRDNLPAACLTRALLASGSNHRLNSLYLFITSDTSVTFSDIYDIFQKIAKYTSLNDLSITISAGVQLAEEVTLEQSAALFAALYVLSKLQILRMGFAELFSFRARAYSFPLNRAIISGLLSACRELRQ
jgi:hypothetical protein